MPTLHCPICQRTVAYETRDQIPHRPFCSSRCRAVDLGRWFNEEYRISEEVPEPSADSEEYEEQRFGRAAGDGGRFIDDPQR